jgi:hypothetical protein
MQNAHERFGALEFIKHTEDSTPGPLANQDAHSGTPEGRIEMD